jgi:peptide/nickel transport system substrate-binding protein
MMDETARRAAYEEAMAKVMADKAYIPLVQLQSVWGTKAGTLTFEPRFDEDTLAFFITPAS